MNAKDVCVVIDIVLGIVGLFFNLFALLAMGLGFKHLLPKHHFLIALNISDIIVSLSRASERLLTFNGVRICILTGFTFSLNFVGFGLLSSSLLCLGCDLYIAICKPLRYEALMTKGRAKVAIATIWVWSVIIGVAFLLCQVANRVGFCEDDERLCLHFMVIFMSHCGICALAVIVIYGKVLWEVWRMSKLVQPFQKQSVPNNAQSTKKAAVTILLILATLALFLLPAYFTFFLDETYDMLWRICINWSMLNSIVDPLIYSVRMSEMRAGYQKMLSFWNRGQ